jgi:UTP--glucose-1-phosphate uridylyltransferase
MMSTGEIKKVVIPAAGLGTRFLPATKASPKEMLPLVDKPLIQYVVEEAVASGIKEVIIITGRGKRAIEDHFDVSFELEANLRANGKRKLLKQLQEIASLANICYVRQREALGLGHAVYQAKPLVGQETFAVLLGDDILDAKVPALAQMMKIYREYHAPVIGVQQVDRQEVSHYGIIKGQAVAPGLQRVMDLVEKPTPGKAPSRYAVIGRYIMVPEIFEFLERIRPGRNQEIQLTDALKLLAKHQPVYACEIKGQRYDAGDKLGFLRATVEFGLKSPELGSTFRQYLKTLHL